MNTDIYPCNFCKLEKCTLDAKTFPANQNLKNFIKKLPLEEQRRAYEKDLETLGMPANI